MREPIAAPPAQPPRFGLLASAAVDGSTGRWQQGFAFQPEACGAGGRLAVVCEGNTEAMDLPDRPGTVEGMPFLVYATDECSTFGFNARDWQGRARRQLAAIESYEVAAELWTGSLGLQDSNGDPIRSLADTSADTLTTAGTPADPVDALALVEQGIAACSRGRRGMVHMTPQLLTQLVRDNVLRLDGTTWITPNGHIVVPDAGYPGTGPNGEAASSTQWLYGTSMISVLLSAVELIPGTLDDARSMAQALDRAVNSAVVFAERLAAWVWDECCHVAAQVDLPMPLVGGAS